MLRLSSHFDMNHQTNVMLSSVSSRSTSPASKSSWTRYVWVKCACATFVTTWRQTARDFCIWRWPSVHWPQPSKRQCKKTSNANVRPMRWPTALTSIQPNVCAAPFRFELPPMVSQTLSSCPRRRRQFRPTFISDTHHRRRLPPSMWPICSRVC